MSNRVARKFRDTALLELLKKAIRKYKNDVGTDSAGAFRDALVDLRHIADDWNLDFGDRDAAAYAVYLEEMALRREHARQ